MIKEILTVQKDIDVLKQPSTPVEFEGMRSEDLAELRELITDLLETATDATNRGTGCAGLAAVQIGVHKRVFVMRWGNKFIPVINPEIVSHEDTVQSVEGCLSRPNMQMVRITRWKRIKVRFINPETGAVTTRKFKNLESRVFQHELGHLNGELI